MGEIVYWTIIRTAILIPTLWVIEGYINPRIWWFVCVISIYVVIIHPAIIQYRSFKSKNKEVLESTLCSTCTHFDESAVLCMLHDKHPTKTFLPCEGLDWEPKSSGVNSEDIYNC